MEIKIKIQQESKIIVFQLVIDSRVSLSTVNINMLLIQENYNYLPILYVD